MARNTTKHFAGHKNEKAPVFDRKLPSNTKGMGATARITKESATHTAAGPQDPACVHASPEGDEEVTDDNETVFMKKRVASTEEIANSGHHRSALHATVAASEASSVAADSDDEEWSDSPWASLLIETPATVDGNERLQNQNCPSHPAAPSNASGSTPPLTWMQTLVILVAGRKKPSHTDNSPVPPPSIPPVPSQAHQPQVDQAPQAETQRPAPPPPTPLPRLTLPDAIPSVQHASAKDPALQPGYVNVPPAPANKYMGYAVLSADAFEPANTQRGFNVPLLCVPDPGPRRNRSEDSLFDRKHDVWANWHARYPKAEENPFSRTNSENELERLDGGGGREVRESAARRMSFPMFVW